MTRVAEARSGPTPHMDTLAEAKKWDYRAEMPREARVAVSMTWLWAQEQRKASELAIFPLTIVFCTVSNSPLLFTFSFA